MFIKTLKSNRRRPEGVSLRENLACLPVSEISDGESLKMEKQMTSGNYAEMVHPSTSPTLHSEWRSIDWNKAWTEVKRLQIRIAKAVKDKDYRRIKSLQWTLTHSFYAKALAVKRVTSNKGKNTPGIDGVLWKTASAKMQAVYDLHQHGYKALPLKRIYIPKKDGKTKRPLSIPTMRDKAMQALYKLALIPVAETTADRNSYGFRESRSSADAVASAFNALAKPNSATWILEADITGCYDNISKSWLMDNIPIEKRILLQWLNAGYVEKGFTYPTRNRHASGGVISPILSNIFLHYVLDDWFKQVVQPRLKGKSFMIRWADDFIIAFEDKSDAERVMGVLPKRFGRFKLELHPDKTSLIQFARPKADEDAKELGTFDFLGFTHYWGKGYTGIWAIKKKTSRKRLTRFLKRTWQWCKENMHELITEQYKTLCSKLRGFYQYFGVRCNYQALGTVYHFVYKAWAEWLSRRTRNGKVRYDELKKNYPLPKPKIVHSI